MYYIPGYIEEEKSESGLILNSLVYGNKVALEDISKIKEYTLLKHIGTKSIHTELERFLCEQKMLCSLEDLQELQNITFEKMNKQLRLTIMPTESCNFRCPYCYEDHQNSQMTSDMVYAIKNFLKEQIPKVKEVNLSWFGGEPTLCPEIILNINGFTQELLKNLEDIQFSSSMTTNGYLLNKEMFLKYYASGIRHYQITLDGFNHDKTRYLANNQGTLETILSNLKEIRLLDSSYNYKIILRRNILATDTDFSWYDYLAQLFGNDPRFSLLIRSVDDWGGEGVKALDIIRDEDKDAILKKHIQYVKSKGLICENDIVDNGISFGSQFCYASYPKSFIFRANGSIQKCTIVLNNSKNIVGQIIGDKVCINESLNQCWTPILHETCISCRRILSCMNKQCPQKLVLNGGEFCCQFGGFERL